jgi:hypothetical protein
MAGPTGMRGGSRGTVAGRRSLTGLAAEPLSRIAWHGPASFPSGCDEPVWVRPGGELCTQTRPFPRHRPSVDAGSVLPHPLSRRWPGGHLARGAPNTPRLQGMAILHHTWHALPIRRVPDQSPFRVKGARCCPSPTCRRCVGSGALFRPSPLTCVGSFTPSLCAVVGSIEKAPWDAISDYGFVTVSSHVCYTPMVACCV